MDVSQSIALGLSIGGVAGGIVWKVATMSAGFGKLQQRLDNNEKRDDEERAHSSAKFSELYNRTAGHDAALATLSANMNSIMDSIEKINKKQDVLESKMDKVIEVAYSSIPKKS